MGERSGPGQDFVPFKSIIARNLCFTFFGNSSAWKEYLQETSTFITIYILQTVISIFLFYRNWFYPKK